MMNDPAQSLVEVTPSDSTDLGITRGIYVGGTGNLNVVTRMGQTVLIQSIPAGTILPIQVRKVMSTSTTATKIVAMY